MSPRRIVLPPWSTGGYGTKMWNHELECGHVVSRKKRVEMGGELPCDACSDEERGRERIVALPDPEALETSSDRPETSPHAEPDELSAQIEWAAMAAAVVASHVGVTSDQVSIHVSDDGSFAGGSVLLTPADISTMIKRLTS